MSKSIDTDVQAVIDSDETSVRFVEAADGSLGVLEVHAPKVSTALTSMSQALQRHDVQIRRCEAKPYGNRLLCWFEVAELDGMPIPRSRWLELQVAILDAIMPGSDPVGQAAPGSVSSPEESEAWT